MSTQELPLLELTAEELANEHVLAQLITWLHMTTPERIANHIANDRKIVDGELRARNWDYTAGLAERRMATLEALMEACRLAAEEDDYLGSEEYRTDQMKDYMPWTEQKEEA